MMPSAYSALSPSEQTINNLYHIGNYTKHKESRGLYIHRYSILRPFSWGGRGLEGKNKSDSQMILKWNKLIRN